MPVQYPNGPTVVHGIVDPKFQNESELQGVLRRLVMGNMMKKIVVRKGKLEERTFQVNLETRQVVWQRAGVLEGSIDISEIKEIRHGKVSRDFDKLADVSRKLDSAVCFTILYGNEFNLKILSIVAKQQSEREVWIRGLSYLVIDTLKSHYTLQVERFLRKEFNQICRRNLITLRTVKAWLPNVNAKALPTSQLKEMFQEVDIRKRGEIGFEQFVQFYYNLMFSCQKSILTFVQHYSSDRLRFTAHDFQKFLIQEQKEDWANDINAVKTFMIEYLGDSSRANDSVYFDNKEMMAYLFSKENSLWNSKYNEIPDGMLDKPLSQYWISSSHNTYLTGDQFSSESSCEAYARALRMGCRCIELDCWDGPDGMPHIYHGLTLTSKIKFHDVLKTIREHAFVVSDLPVILSIENHCKLPQQRHMATKFVDIFQDMLVRLSVSANEQTLPSPNQLRGKIIIKHKKLSDANRSTEVFIERSTADLTMDISNSVKNGMMYFEDPTFKEWNLHYFVLTEDNKLVYTEERQTQPHDDTTSEDGSIDESANNDRRGSSDTTELHYAEKWYHGQMGRDEADQLLRDYNGKDGSFMVRESATFIGNCTLSFMYHGRVTHCRIHSQQNNGHTYFYLVHALLFDSLYSLVWHYQRYPLRNAKMNFELLLTEPVPQPNAHANKEWYHDSMTRTDAENVLMRIPRDGAFLVRKCRSDDPSVTSFAISFRADGKIKHCRIKQESRLFVIGNATFETLCDVISFYEKNPLYRKMKLKHPATKEQVQCLLQEPNFYSEDHGAVGGSVAYVPPNFMSVTVKALYDYRAARDDELTFCKHAIISNVIKQDGGWWRGDYGGKAGMWFPSNYVEEMESASKEPGSTNLDDAKTGTNVLGDMQKGVIDLANSNIELLPSGRGHQKHAFRICRSNGDQLHLATETKDDLVSWLNNLKEAIDKHDSQAKKWKDIEKHTRIAVELSDLIVYCRPVQFNENAKGHCYEMSSFPESKAERYACRDKARIFINYNRKQFSRIYPKGSRVESSNYNPMPFWNCGTQLAALNFQTGDRSMQLNEARFEMFNRCGYVLQPQFFENELYHPYNKGNIQGVEPLIMNIQVIGARHLPKSGRGLACPFIEVEIIGCDYDDGKVKTPKKDDNGLNPTWDNSSSTNNDSSFDFDILVPDTAFLRFTVYDQDMFGDPNFLAMASIPVPCVKSGLRSVPLKNTYSEDIPLAALLVHLDVRSAKEEDDGLYDSIQRLRDQTKELQSKISSQQSYNPTDMMSYHQQLCETQKALFMQNEQRKERMIQRLRH
uniref:1-phosphatidylinositol 4,5-bisphosphate phosphodiesterase gamma-1 isoform X2 n=1 Tax=Ciona intestinalis TaxID=7719 RepID=UPI00089DD690|nr:1-phosphatidylinositol 4,5-bisphosphate phosphodiesterase gamma-1 isoform X2 [Ciona intestinalis]|eukprot:XP_018666895.1 1-phosphatidylinositol 4,5-bisphosphate phosphodiesterase gamma-1 isoform X2 [Ciona intestinalis]